MVYKLDESSKNCKYCGWGTSGSLTKGFYSDAGTPLFCSNKLIGLYMVGPVCRHSKQNVHVFVNVGSYNRWISEVTNLIDSASLYSFNMLLLFLIPLLHLYI
ncbi:uncharacterized protein LOC142329794 [Lycorma delicatula]|uniref:uncharacterized protein LOC142329794 n=1 Tax=Lycorma delicatula TaxID=130591 RepID=UPI003F50EFB7